MTITNFMDSKMTLSEMEEYFRFRVIKAAVRLENGNMCAAARRLQVHPNTLYRYARKLQEAK